LMLRAGPNGYAEALKTKNKIKAEQEGDAY